jgi:hypothetical protein
MGGNKALKAVVKRIEEKEKIWKHPYTPVIVYITVGKSPGKIGDLTVIMPLEKALRNLDEEPRKKEGHNVDK